MAAILALVTRLLGLVGELLGIANLIRGLTQNAAQEHSPYLIEGIVTTAGIALAHPTYGLAALETRLDAIDAAIAALNAPVLSAIAALPAGSALVIPSDSDNADAVWGYVNGATPAPGTYAVNAQLAEAWGVLTELYRSGAWRINGSPWFTVEWPGAPITYLSTAFAYPTPDWSAIGAYTSVVDWLNATDTSGRTWALDPDAGLATTFDTLPGEQWYALRCLLRDADVYPMAGRLPPVWPGLANVTLGAPIALSADLELAGPMDGVLISITTPPTGLGKFVIGDRTWWYRLGQIAFVSDNGEVEPWQYLAWDQSVYCPRQMAHAASALIRCLAGAEGTATPWVLN